MGIDRIRSFFASDDYVGASDSAAQLRLKPMGALIDDLSASGKKVIFVLGKGGVGKTCIAATIALGLARKGTKVHLTSTDPADHLSFVIENTYNITQSHIDEREELKNVRMRL